MNRTVKKYTLRRIRIMKKVMILVIFLLSATLMSFGCSLRNKPEPLIKPVKANAVDANKNGVFDDGDLFILYDLSDKIYEDQILPYMKKADIGSKAELGSPDALIKLRGSLTVIEFERFMQNIEEWNTANSQIDATAKAITDIKVEPAKLVSKSDKALGAHVWGQIELSTGIVIKYAGIKIPVGGTDNRFSRVVNLISNKFIAGRLIRYELTGRKVGNTSEAYVYVGELCINEELVKMGYALAIRDKSEKSEKLIKLEEESKASRRGLWAFHPNDNPFAEPLY